MRAGKITYMYVITNRRAVRCRIICAEYRDRWSHTCSNFEHQWNEMGLGIVILANLGRRLGASSVEVPQPGRFQPVGAIEIIHHPFTNELSEAIWIDRIRPRAFDNRNAIRLSINGAAR